LFREFMGQEFQVDVTKLVADDLSNIAVVEGEGIIREIAERANQSLHVTLSHALAVSASRSNQLLNGSGEAREGKLCGRLGVAVKDAAGEVTVVYDPDSVRWADEEDEQDEEDKFLTSEGMAFLQTHLSRHAQK